MDSPATKQKGGAEKKDGKGDGQGEGGEGQNGQGGGAAPPPQMDPVKAEEQEWDKALESAAQLDRAQSEKSKGSMPNPLRYLIDESRQNPVDLYTLLRRFMDSTTRSYDSWARPNRQVRVPEHLPAG